MRKMINTFISSEQRERYSLKEEKELNENTEGEEKNNEIQKKFTKNMMKKKYGQRKDERGEKYGVRNASC